MEGSISIFEFPIRALFDSGASHSFISSSLVDRLHLDLSLVVDPIVVSNPIGGSTHLTMVCRGLRLYIMGVEFDCDAFVLGFSGYGMILGMDWLSAYGAILDCERRVVRLETSRGRILEVSCDPKESIMLSFLYSLDSSSAEMHAVPVVREFLTSSRKLGDYPLSRKSIFVSSWWIMRSLSCYL